MTVFPLPETNVGKADRLDTIDDVRYNESDPGRVGWNDRYDLR